MELHKDIQAYNKSQSTEDQVTCELLAREITAGLPEAENKVWHAHPVWFLEGNPIVGYSRQKAGIRLMFWSGVDFNEPNLTPGTGKYKDASIFYNASEEIDTDDLKKWLEKSRRIQWDYKNIVKRRGVLEKVT